MKQHIEKAMTFNLSASAVWKILDDFGGIEHYAPTIQSSSIIGETHTGLGAQRQCRFADGSSLIETIIEYNDGEGYRMELSDYSFPLKYMYSDISVIPLSDTSCEITMSTDFLVKAGPLGWLLGHFVMRPIMKGAFEKVMSGLACYTASGEVIGDALPTDNTLERLTAA
ncbi:SRPBCC family protein [Vibrio ulleungensis]|uniref:SRPBCC family protein n=1 Tax=Vibrio ulleungensis TaxID=2807619 RepID=A0ABS2HBR1_9VIBR|nr:SRPBCC family protein [Vibrio ulleungensis]MBM7035035.1 SRPBCC family protein [Vibrio ulleungensis]